MPQFTDAEGRKWSITINVAALKRVRKLTDVDLFGALDDNFAGINKLFANPEKLCDVLYAIVQPDAEKTGVTDDQFGVALGGDALGSAADALIGGLVDFFPDAKTRTRLRQVLSKDREIRDLMAEQDAKRIAAIDPQKIVAEIESKLSSSTATSSPASSASTPDHSP